MNSCIFTGNLTKDPEMRYTQSGTAVTSFSIANNEGWGDNKKVLFLDCVAWGTKTSVGQAGAIADNLKKGAKVVVQGELSKRSYENKQGVTVWVTELTVRRCEFLDGKPKENGNHTEQVPVGDPSDVDPDEIPF